MSTLRQQSQSDAESGERRSDQLQPAQDLVDYIKQYARQKPEAVALWCFGVGSIVGWKLKPW